jgi:hypothetical protein
MEKTGVQSLCAERRFLSRLSLGFLSYARRSPNCGQVITPPISRQSASAIPKQARIKINGYSRNSLPLAHTLNVRLVIGNLHRKRTVRTRQQSGRLATFSISPKADSTIGFRQSLPGIGRPQEKYPEALPSSLSSNWLARSQAFGRARFPKVLAQETL